MSCAGRGVYVGACGAGAWFVCGPCTCAPDELHPMGAVHELRQLLDVTAVLGLRRPSHPVHGVDRACSCAWPARCNCKRQDRLHPYGCLPRSQSALGQHNVLERCIIWSLHAADMGMLSCLLLPREAPIMSHADAARGTMALHHHHVGLQCTVVSNPCMCRTWQYCGRTCLS